MIVRSPGSGCGSRRWCERTTSQSPPVGNGNKSSGVPVWAPPNESSNSPISASTRWANSSSASGPRRRRDGRDRPAQFDACRCARNPRRPRRLGTRAPVARPRARATVGRSCRPGEDRTSRPGRPPGPASHAVRQQPHPVERAARRGVVPGHRTVQCRIARRIGSVARRSRSGSRRPTTASGGTDAC